MEQDPEELLCLIKFGREDRLKQIMEQGYLYMSSVDSFKTTENPDGRNDEFEGAFNLMQMAEGSLLRYEHPDGSSGVFPVQAGIFHEYIVGNLACFYGVSGQHFTDGRWNVDIDDRMTLLGEHVLFIHNKNEFIRRVEKKVYELNMNVTHAFVRYDYDEKTHNGPLNLLQKRTKFSYQREYRFFLNSGKQDTFILELGNLSDICKVMPYKVFKETKFHISKRTMKFKVSPTEKKSIVRDFISTDKRLQLQGDFIRFKGMVLHLGASTGHSKPIYLFNSETFVNEDITWCKNMWFEWEYTDKEYIVEVLLT